MGPNTLTFRFEDAAPPGQKPVTPSGGNFPVPAGGRTLREEGGGIAQQLGQILGQIPGLQQAPKLAAALPKFTEMFGGGKPIPVAPTKQVTDAQAQNLPSVESAEGGGGMLAAAGPIGLIVAGAMYAANKIKEKILASIDAVGNAAERAGQTGAMLAHGENARAIGEVGKGFVALSGQMPVFGEYLERVGGVAIKTVGALNTLTEAFISRAQEIGGYSPQLATANAMAEVRSLLGDIREADRLGPEMARLVDAESRLSNDLREMLLPVKEFIIRNLADFVAWLRDFLLTTKVLIEGIAEVIGGIKTGNEEIAGHGVAVVTNLEDFARTARMERDRKANEDMKNLNLGALFDQLDFIDRRFRAMHIPGVNRAMLDAIGANPVIRAGQGNDGLGLPIINRGN